MPSNLPSKPATRRLTWMYVASLTSIALFAIGGHFLVKQILKEQLTSTQAISEVETQRSLSQQLAKLALSARLTEGEDRQALLTETQDLLKQWDASYEKLKNSDSQLSFADADVAQIKRMIATLDPLRQSMRSTVEQLVSNEAASRATITKLVNPVIKSVVQASKTKQPVASKTKQPDRAKPVLTAAPLGAKTVSGQPSVLEKSPAKSENRAQLVVLRGSASRPNTPTTIRSAARPLTQYGRTPATRGKPVRQLLAQEAILQNRLSKLVVAYNDATQLSLARLQLLEEGLLVVMLGVLVLEGFLIFRPVVGQVQTAFSALNLSLKETQEARDKLALEQERSERLLLNILPEPIAEQLKQQEGAIAEGFGDVTILFADIVGFTSLSSIVSPHELVVLLNRIFSTFDQLAEKHGLEKIKTIGDAYMVVGGLPLPREDHAAAIADMALDMQIAMTRLATEIGQPLQIRIGINSGPVVAGVIGIKKFIYDLWGDTVNIASRMESHGIPGGIQVTEATYQLLKHQYALEERGVITVKGKGEMMAYLLKGKGR